MYHWKKLEVDLTQDGLPQLLDLGLNCLDSYHSVVLQTLLLEVHDYWYKNRSHKLAHSE